jgi:hypothetical protein
VTVLNERVGLDTNVFLLGLRKVDPHSERLLTYLDRLRLVIPERILRELSVNLTAAEMKEFYDLFGADTDVLFDWTPPSPNVVRRYLALGCKRGDAFVAAGIEILGATAFISNNRHFLREITGLPFRVLAPAAALVEIEGSI